MNFLRTPGPFPSTIISLQPSEQFTYRRHTIQSVTISPLPADRAAPYTLSGTSSLRGHHQSFAVPQMPPQTPPLLRAQAEAELARPLHAVPGAQQAPTPVRSKGASRA